MGGRGGDCVYVRQERCTSDAAGGQWLGSKGMTGGMVMGHDTHQQDVVSVGRSSVEPPADPVISSPNAGGTQPSLP